MENTASIADFRFMIDFESVGGAIIVEDLPGRIVLPLKRFN